MAGSGRNWDSYSLGASFKDLDQAERTYFSHQGIKNSQRGTGTGYTHHSDGYDVSSPYPPPLKTHHSSPSAKDDHLEVRQPINQGQRLGKNFNHSTLDDQHHGTGLDLSKSLGGGGGDPYRTASGRVRTRFPITMARDGHGTSEVCTEYEVAKRQYLEDTVSSCDKRSESVLIPTSKAYLLSDSTIKEALANRNSEDGQRAREEDGGAYFPFGKPGAGAPLASEDGKASQRMKGTLHFDTSADARKRRRRGADIYLAELKHEMAERENRDHESRAEANKQADTLADIIRHGLVGNPKRDPETGLLQNQHNPTSDVTKYKDGRSQTPPQNKKEYHNDLSRIAEERHRIRQIDKLREKHEEINHERHWTEYWGRPGGGAPNQKHYEGGHKKANLNAMLFGSSQESNLQVKNTANGMQQVPANGHHQRSHVASKHSNMYQSDAGPGRSKPDQKSYVLTTPFATHDALIGNGA